MSQFVSNPTNAHQQAAYRILRYIKGVPGAGLFFHAKKTPQLKDYSDSDWVGCIDTRRSVTGFSIYLGFSLISWRSKKQETVSRSCSEAEYRALASAICDIQWLTYLLEDLLVPFIQTALLFCDNKLVLHIVANQVFHESNKHIEIDCHIVKNKVQSGILRLLPVSSSH